MRIGTERATRVATAAVLAVGGLAAVPSGASAASYDVTTLADAGTGSLRQALFDASSDGTDDVVTIDPTLAGGTITLTTGELVHAGDAEALTIHGADVTVDAVGTSRVLRHDSTGVLTIEDLTITGGQLHRTDEEEFSPPDYGYEIAVTGSGVRSDGAVVLDNVVITANRIDDESGIPAAQGAGLYSAASVHLIGTRVMQNTIAGSVERSRGAGVKASEIRAYDSTIEGNAITVDGSESFGAGAHTGTFVAERSDLTNNTIDKTIIAAGGGVFADQADLTEVTVADNSVFGGHLAAGGGIAADALTMQDASVTGNTARGVVSLPGAVTAGGGAYVGRAQITSSNVDRNVAVGWDAHGGAIAMETPFDSSRPLGADAVIDVRRSQLLDNRVEAEGDATTAAGGAMFGTGISVTESLVAQNSVKAWNSSSRAAGGAITVAFDGPKSVIDDSTIALNTVVGDHGEGGAVDAEVGPLEIIGSTIADNGAGAGTALRIAPGATVSVSGSSLSGPPNLCSGADPAVSHVVATDGSCTGATVEPDVGLGALADNGGPTLTMSPLAGSPLSDAIPAGTSICAGTDQRGVARPVGPACDIGAVEVTDPIRAIGDLDARLAAGDLDGDAVDDLLGHRPGPPIDGIAWNGDPVALGKYAIQGDYEPLLGDFDGDGDDDIFWYAAGTAYDYIFWADGDRTFTVGNTSVNGTYRPLVGDFDRNGVDDVFWYGVGNRGDYVWWGDGDRTFTSRPSSVQGVYQPISGDFDGDGAHDIVWYAPGGATDYVWWSGGNRSFSSAYIRVNGTYLTSSGDFDGDGSDDIVWYAPGSGGDYVWWGARSRRFASVPKRVGGSFVPVSGDFTGDGADDLFLHGAGSRADRMYRGASRSVFLSS